MTPAEARAYLRSQAAQRAAERRAHAERIARELRAYHGAGPVTRWLRRVMPGR